MKKVAIIGAGPSGLVSAKCALENGLAPTIFEKSPHICGLWSGSENTPIWDGLRTNSTRFISTFSDHPWPEGARLYPLAYEMRDYLMDYARKFDLEKYIRVNRKVKSVKYSSETRKWHVIHKNVLGNKEKRTDVFDFVAVASGAYAKPRLPKDVDANKFKGSIMHSSEFRLNDARLRGPYRKVLVVGGSISAVDICTHLVESYRALVCHLFRRTPLVVPFLWTTTNEKRLPYEFVLYTRELNYPRSESKSKLKQLLKQLFPFQFTAPDFHTGCPESLELGNNEELKLTLSDRYMDYVTATTIKPVKSTIKKFDKHGVYLENGTFVAADVVIYCTGYDLGIDDYLDTSILESLRYCHDKPRMPALFYKCTFCPDFDTLAFVGQNSGLCFTGVEMQANWAMAVFAGKVLLPSRDLMRVYVNSLEARRDCGTGTVDEAQYPYGSYVTMLDEIAQELGVLPDFRDVRNRDAALFDCYWSNLVNWAHFWGDNENRLDVLKKIRDFKV